MRLVRFVFRLPSFLPVPDGTTVSQAYPHPASSYEGQTPFALLRLHQIELEDDEALGVDMRVSGVVLDRIQTGDGRDGPDRDTFPTVATWHTVADVVTTYDSPDEPDPDWDGRPQHLGPRQDALMRALHSVQTFTRCVRLTEQSRIVMPTYERMPLMIMWLVATALEADGRSRIPPDADWSPGGVMVLDHTNIVGGEESDPVRQGELLEQSGFWARSLAAGSPAPLAREQLVEAQHLLHHQGEYAKATVAVATAVEVMCDSVLSALLWEEQWASDDAPDPVQAARHFDEGRSAARVTSLLVPRLGGDWSAPSSPWQLWRVKGASLRNRIVHAGYQPTRQEAQVALSTAEALQRFIFDRVSARASRFPRTALMLVARSGLEKRGLYRGPITEFAATEAVSEPAWIEAFGAWHQALVAARNS